MIVTFLNQKGGVGKTTLALLLGSILKEAGYDIAIDDKDPQQSASFLAKNVFNIPLISEVKKASYVITDTPGHMTLEGDEGRTLVNLINNSDRIILISEKSLISVHASMPMAKLINKHKKPNTKAYLLFNKVRQTTTMGKQSEKEIAKDLEISLLKNSIPLAAAYENSQADGLLSISGVARDKLLNLALEIMK